MRIDFHLNAVAGELEEGSREEPRLCQRVREPAVRLGFGGGNEVTKQRRTWKSVKVKPGDGVLGSRRRDMGSDRTKGESGSNMAAENELITAKSIRHVRMHML